MEPRALATPGQLSGRPPGKKMYAHTALFRCRPFVKDAPEAISAGELSDDEMDKPRHTKENAKKGHVGLSPTKREERYAKRSLRIKIFLAGARARYDISAEFAVNQHNKARGASAASHAPVKSEINHDPYSAGIDSTEDKRNGNMVVL